MDSWVNHIKKCNTHLPAFRDRLAKINGEARYLTTSSQRLLNFVSNDYLGLGSHPQILEALINAGKIYGLGSSGAPSLSGYSEEHELLAREMAQWLGYDKCLLFSSGYQLNIGIYSQLADRNTCVWLDKNCHASHIDGIMLARTNFITFNKITIDKIILKIKQQSTRRHLILSEGSFSMDGTCAYLDKLIQLKMLSPENILLVIDDAHGIGTLGAYGYGTLEQLGLNRHQVDLVIGTFSKAFATHGGFICGNAAIINYLEQSVRSRIFSTNLPPAIAAASRASLAIINSPHGQALRRQLTKNIEYFDELAGRYGLNVNNHDTNYSPIKLLIYTDTEKLMQTHNYLLEQNILSGKIVYPTVAKAKPRLRISLNTWHEKQDINKLLNCLAQAAQLA